MQKKVYVLGSLNIDLVIGAKRIPNQGETISGDSFEINAGGKGGNQAVAAAKLGLDVAMISAIGSDSFSKMIIESLKDAKVDVSRVKEVQKNTGVAVILKIKNDNRIILDKGANYELTIKDVEKTLNGKSGDLFVAQFETPYEVVEYGLKTAKEKGMITILNPAPAEFLVEELYNYIDYLVVNQSECETLIGVYPKNHDEVKDAYLKFKNKGLKRLIVTLGENGSSYIDEEKNYYKNAHLIKPVDTTGAGDSFVGALAYGINEGLKIEEILNICNATSALVCLKKGAQVAMPSLKEVKEFIEHKKE